jgi:hypothetical protein
MLLAQINIILQKFVLFACWLIGSTSVLFRGEKHSAVTPYSLNKMSLFIFVLGFSHSAVPMKYRTFIYYQVPCLEITDQ